MFTIIINNDLGTIYECKVSKGITFYSLSLSRLIGMIESYYKIKLFHSINYN